MASSCVSLTVVLQVYTSLTVVLQVCTPVTEVLQVHTSLTGVLQVHMSVTGVLQAHMSLTAVSSRPTRQSQRSSRSIRHSQQCPPGPHVIHSRLLRFWVMGCEYLDERPERTWLVSQRKAMDYQRQVGMGQEERWPGQSSCSQEQICQSSET